MTGIEQCNFLHLSPALSKWAELFESPQTELSVRREKMEVLEDKRKEKVIRIICLVWTIVDVY